MVHKRCAICKKASEIVMLHEGIYENEIVMVCHECAHEEHVPLLKKPSREQLEVADDHLSVRERMERLSGMHRRRTVLGKDAAMIRNTMGRLKMPAPKDTHEDVADQYYWTLNMARRRKKMTINQVSVATGIDVHIIEAIEKGKIPKEFEQIFVKLEDFFNITLLKNKKRLINFVSQHEVRDEAEILHQVRRKMEKVRDLDDEDEYATMDKLQREHKLKHLEEGELDFSDPSQLEDVTLDDLVELKRKREKEAEINRLRKQTNDLMGDDIEFV